MLRSSIKSLKAMMEGTVGLWSVISLADKRRLTRRWWPPRTACGRCVACRLWSRAIVRRGRDVSSFVHDVSGVGPLCLHCSDIVSQRCWNNARKPVLVVPVGAPRSVLADPCYLISTSAPRRRHQPPFSTSLPSPLHSVLPSAAQYRLRRLGCTRLGLRPRRVLGVSLYALIIHDFFPI